MKGKVRTVQLNGRKEPADKRKKESTDTAKNLTEIKLIIQ
jgi:hypothetical protein